MFRLVTIHFCLMISNDFFSKTDVQFWSHEEVNAIQKDNIIQQNRKPVETDTNNSSTKQPIDEFLEDPSEQNALKYLQWQQQRLNKFFKAVKMLRRAKEKAIIAEKVSKNRKAFVIKHVK